MHSMPNTPPPIPTPREAAQLRAAYAINPVVDSAEQALRAFDRHLHVRDAARLLESWKHYAELTDLERRAVLSRFVPPPASRCSICKARIRYITDGPQPGWWAHTDVAGTRGRPHPAEPLYDRDDSNSASGWPFNRGGAR